MKLKGFLKANLTVTIGISLPLILVIIFALGAVLPKLLVSAPKYNLLYMTTAYPHDGISTELTDGKLQLSITSEVRKGILPIPRLFLFDYKTKSTKEIPITLPPISHNMAGSKKETVEILELQNLRLHPTPIAPDGYKAEFSSPNYGSAANFLISNSYKRSLTINKSGNSIVVVEETNNKYGDKSIKFLGWVIPQ